MQRSILHWTAGTHKVSALDRQHYHIISDGTGVIHKGIFPFEANNAKRLYPGRYAAHTRGTNTGAGGFACAGMLGAEEYPLDFGSYPVTKASFDAIIQEIAKFHRAYSLPVTERTCLHHAEVEENLGIWQRGKWDLTVLQWKPALRGADDVGDYIRKEVKKALGKEEAVMPRPASSYSKRTLWLQRLLNKEALLPQPIAEDGWYGPETAKAVMAFEAANNLTVTGSLYTRRTVDTLIASAEKRRV